MDEKVRALINGAIDYLRGVWQKLPDEKKSEIKQNLLTKGDDASLVIYYIINRIIEKNKPDKKPVPSGSSDIVLTALILLVIFIIIVFVSRRIIE